MGYTPHVLVVGGGATGAGLTRDLAMRGLEVTLVERGPLTAGATGSGQGLLYSGARFADADPETARDCAAENDVLRSVADHCIDDVGGLVVEHPDDPADHFEATLDACEAVEIPHEELSGRAAVDWEPALSSDSQRALAVQDAAIDPFRLTADTARDAQAHGAAVLTHAEVVDVLVEDDIVEGIEVRENPPIGEPTVGDVAEIDADYVVNVTGAWAGEVAAMADLDVPVRSTRGVTTVMATRHTERVVTRCRPPGEGDVVVPSGEVSLLGATDLGAGASEDAREGQDVETLFEELEPVVPSLSDARALRSYWGVWGLWEGDDGEDPGRSFVVLDHEDRDGVWGMSTVVGGTLTTHRLVAERVADHVCGKFGIDRACLTDDRPLPGSDTDERLGDAMGVLEADGETREQARERLGTRTAEVLDTEGHNPLVCPCRRVTRAEVRTAMDAEGVYELDLDAVRRRTGAGTGDCQGTRCCHRVAAELYPGQGADTVTDALDGFYQERWEGQRHVLWGEQLSRAMGSYALHATTMNRDRPVTDPVLADFDDGPELDREWPGPVADDGFAVDVPTGPDGQPIDQTDGEPVAAEGGGDGAATPGASEAAPADDSPQSGSEPGDDDAAEADPEADSEAADDEDDLTENIPDFLPVDEEDVRAAIESGELDESVLVDEEGDDE